MATLTIKNLPKNIHQALRSRAEDNGRSLNGEVIFCLKEVLGEKKINLENTLSSIDRVREDGCKLDLKLLQEALEDGRR